MLALGVGQRYFLYCAGFIGSRDSMKVLRPHSGLVFRTGLPIYIHREWGHFAILMSITFLSTFVQLACVQISNIGASGLICMGSNL